MGPPDDLYSTVGSLCSFSISPDWVDRVIRFLPPFPVQSEFLFHTVLALVTIAGVEQCVHNSVCILTGGVGADKGQIPVE